MKYVPITRHFREVTEAPKSGYTQRFLRDIRGEDSLTWRGILRHYTTEKDKRPDAVILIAPSGTGKSTEIKELAVQLRKSGHAAFCSAAGAIAADGFRSSLDSACVARFDEWVIGTAPAVVFLDAVDEVYLRKCTFADVVRRMEHDINFVARDVQFVVVARTGTWTDDHLGDLARLLVLRKKDPTTKMITFEPLDHDAILAIAESEGVVEPEAFLRSFIDEEIDRLIDLRPCDVPLLAGYWNEHKRFDKWSAILQSHIDAGIADHNPNLRSGQTLSPERRKRALQRIAAASVLTGIPHVTLPGIAPVPGAMAAAELFPDHTAPELSELFGCGLFSPKGETAVQLPQGALTHFLAAQWFAERYRKGLPVDQIQSMVLTKVFGLAEWQVPQSRSALVGWLASDLQELRKNLIDEHPWVVLYEGDPERLSTNDIRPAFGRMMELASLDRAQPWPPSKGTLRRLARPDLQRAIHELLRKKRGVASAEHHLLSFVQAGGYADCTEIALEIALNPKSDAISRAQAIAVVGELGTAPEVATLISLAQDSSSLLRNALAKVLIPLHLRGPQLVDFILKIDDWQLRQTVADVIHKADVVDIDAALTAMRGSLTDGVESELSENLVQTAVALVASRLRRSEELPACFPVLFGALECRLDRESAPKRHIEAIRKSLRENQKARQLAWSGLIAAVADEGAAVSLYQPHLCPICWEDASWLWQERDRAATETQRRELGWVAKRAYADAPKEQRERPGKLARVPAGLLKQFEEEEARRRRDFAKERSRQRQQKTKAAQTKRKNIRALRSRRFAIESGEDMGCLRWAWARVRSNESCRAHINIGALRDLVGEQLADSFVLGFKACWRRQDVPMPTPGGNSIPIDRLAGLAGLTLDIQDGLEVARLSESEAGLAARYALYELNSFPPWIGELLTHHPQVVRQTLRDAIEAEWCAEGEGGHYIWFAANSSKSVLQLAESVILDLLRKQPSNHAPKIQAAAEVLMRGEGDDGRLATLCRAQIEVSADREDKALAVWAKVWAYVEPIVAVDWLAQRYRKQPEKAAGLILATAHLLEEDRSFREQVAAPRLNDPRVLERWYRLLCAVVPFERDVHHRGAYVPSERDDAQTFRDWCIRRLRNDPSLEAHRALQRLAADRRLRAQRRHLQNSVDEQISNAIEAGAMRLTEAEVVRVEQGDAVPPRSAESLFEMVRGHLDRVRLLVENDDFSYRDLFRPNRKEAVFQRWVASSLKLVSQGLYSIEREPEYQDKKKVDISATAGEWRVPVEIKPASRYTFRELKRCITHQLYGKYMRPANVNCGVLVLIRDQETKKVIDGERVGFPTLVQALRSFSEEFGTKHSKVIKISTIDFCWGGNGSRKRL